jgi:hypothetical protein
MSVRTLFAVALVWLAASITYLQLTDFPFTPDSYAYVAAARSLTDRAELTVPFAPSYASTLPVAYTAWPPGFPVTIASVHQIGLDMWRAARLVSMLGMALALVLLSFVARPSEGCELASVLVLISASTAMIAVHAWSEGPFAALLVLCLWAAHRFGSATRPQMRYLAVALISAGLATMFRYAGIFLLPPIVMLAWRSELRLYRITAALGALIASTPLALWFWRNAQVGVSWRGAMPHPPSWWRAPAEFFRAAGEMSVAPVGLPSWVQACAGFVLIAWAVYSLWSRRPRLRGSALAITAGWFLSSFVVGMVLARSLGMTGVLDARLIWPVLPITALLVGAWVATEPTGRRRLAGLVIPILLLTQSVSVVALARVRPSLEYRLRERTLPPALQSETALLANRAWETWRQTGRPAYYVPMKEHDATLLHADSLTAWAASRRVRYLVWFDEGATDAKQRATYGDLFDLVHDRSDSRALECVWRGDSVAVYRIRGDR